jgi:hypothetical protein
MALWAALAFIRFPPVAIVVVLIEVSWPGVERVWYLRAFNEGTIAPYEFAQLWRAFFWRFVRLGLIAIAPIVVLIAATRADVATTAQRAIVLIVYIVGMDFALTFVTPALAFSTRRVRDALMLGVRMIRSEWPRCALYVLAPPLAIEAVVGLRWIASLGEVGSYAVSGFAAVMALAFKGATAAFYLRRCPCGASGSAWPEPMPASAIPGEAQEHAPGRRPNVPEDRMRRSRKPR